MGDPAPKPYDQSSQPSLYGQDEAPSSPEASVPRPSPHFPPADRSVRLHDTSLGAALGSPATDPLQALYQARRGRFPLSLASSLSNWTMAKWATSLSLKDLDFRTELEMEKWFSDAGRKFIAHGATASVARRGSAGHRRCSFRRRIRGRSSRRKSDALRCGAARGLDGPDRPAGAVVSLR